MKSFSSLEFASFLAGSKAVRFGDFKLKSGRRSPFFINLGEIATGQELRRLGTYFATFLVERQLHHVDVIFGPAYKGISLAVATAIALDLEHGVDIKVAFNRKVAKDHAEGGCFVGTDLRRCRSAVVLDDVVTDGGTKYEALEMLHTFPNLEIRAFVVAVDREERDEAGLYFRDRFRSNTGVDILSLTNWSQVASARPAQTAPPHFP